MVSSLAECRRLPLRPCAREAAQCKKWAIRNARRQVTGGRLLILVFDSKRSNQTPCFSDASMKASRSPSSTFCVALISTLVRKSLMRLLSST